jgi:thymidylate kinase
MVERGVPEAALRHALTTLGPYVVLRNHDIFSHLGAGGDVDLLVADLSRAEERLVAELGVPRVVYRRSYVTQLFYDWGHVDLVPSLEWRGARYLSESDVLASATPSPLGLPSPRLAHEAVVSWFSSLLWGGFFKERYRDVIVAAATDDGDELARVLNSALGTRWGSRMWTWAREGRPEASQDCVKQLRLSVWVRSMFRAPVQTCRGRLRFYWWELRLHLHPPLPWLAVLGPDGSGKSTTLHALVDVWPPSLGVVRLYHLRPRRFAGRSGSSTEPVEDPHGSSARGVPGSTAALGFTVLDWWVGYWSQIVRQRVKGALVLFDRHFIDVQVDPLRYRYGGPPWLPRLISRLIPKPDIVIVLDAPPEVVRARKQEVSAAESTRQQTAYRALQASTPGSHLVDATLPPSEVASVVLRLLRQQMLARTR